MAYVHSNDSVASIISLVLALLSILSCLLVISSVYLYPKAKESFHLQLVNRLLLSDLGLSSCVAFYYFIQYALNSSQLRQFCNIYHPVLLYFFISSYCCTCILSLRFRTLNDSGPQKKVWTPPIHLNFVWLLPLLCSIPVLISAFVTGEVTTVHVNSQDTNQVCTFNHDTDIGTAMDLTFFQFPLFLTILINGYFYTKGVLALQNSPHSVIARQMNRAGGFMLVLLIVWVPNICYNLLTIFAGTNDSYLALLDLCVFLTSSQGLLDVAVYVWSNQQLRKWWYRNFVFFRIFDICFKTNTNKNMNGASNGTKEEEKDSDDEDDWLETSLSFSGLTRSDVSSAMNGGDVENPINASAIRNIDKVAPKTKSILVGGQGKNKEEIIASSVEIDNEKFVRFGENSTRFISTSTQGRASEIAMITRASDCDVIDEEGSFDHSADHDANQLYAVAK